MDFRLSKEQQRLQQKCCELAKDFATRSAHHDRDASHPIENYQRLETPGFSTWEGEFPRDPDSLLERMGFKPSVLLMSEP